MRKLINRLSNSKGFTLVELIVVIAVLAIVTILVSPLMIEYVEKARIGTDRNTVGEVGHAAEVVFVKHDKKTEVEFAIKINDKGIANYAGDGGDDYIADVAEIVPPNVYTYKSKAYKNHIVSIKVDEYGVAHINDELIRHVSFLEKLGITDPEELEEWKALIDEKGKEWFQVDNLSDKLDDLIYDIETDKGAFDKLSKADKIDQLNKKAEEELNISHVGTMLGVVGLLKDPPGTPCGKCSCTVDKCNHQWGTCQTCGEWVGFF